MKKIEIALVNPGALTEARKNLAFCARLTQRGHSLSSMADIRELYNQPATSQFITNMSKLPHPTLQKFAAVNIIVVGASRRFLAQITRHQNEVKFMSASLQYSDYSNNEGFVIPYELYERDANHVGNAQYAENYHQMQYINSCLGAMRDYTSAREQGVDNDTCGYMAPHGLRNILFISATPYQWSHMISQRVCRRNTSEMRYVMLRIWQLLYRQAPELFNSELVGPFCMHGKCKEGKMCCGNPIGDLTLPREYNDISKIENVHDLRNNTETVTHECMNTPTDILNKDFPLLMTPEMEANFCIL